MRLLYKTCRLAVVPVALLFLLGAVALWGGGTALAPAARGVLGLLTVGSYALLVACASVLVYHRRQNKSGAPRRWPMPPGPPRSRKTRIHQGGA